MHKIRHFNLHEKVFNFFYQIMRKIRKLCTNQNPNLIEKILIVPWFWGNISLFYHNLLASLKYSIWLFISLSKFHKKGWVFSFDDAWHVSIILLEHLETNLHPFIPKHQTFPEHFRWRRLKSYFHYFVCLVFLFLFYSQFSIL